MQPYEGTLAFDLGGSHVAAALIDTSGVLRSEVSSCSINKDSDAEAIIEAFKRAAAPVTQSPRLRVNSIAVATPGPFDYSAGVSLMQHKHASLYQIDIRDRLAQALGFPEAAFTFVNDAAAFALGEVTHTGCKHLDRICVIDSGTGIGSAFWLNGGIREQGLGIPQRGELYNLPWGDGIIEDFVSTSNLVQTYASLTGVTLGVREVAELAPVDETARCVFRKFGRQMGMILDATLSAFQPQMIIFGGGIARSGHLFIPSMQQEFRRIQPKIQVSMLFERAGLLGAALCTSNSMAML